MNLVFEVLTYLVAPGNRDFSSPAVHLTVVLWSTTSTNSSRNGTAEAEQHFTVPHIVGIDIEAQATVQHAEIETDIALIRLVPMNILIDTGTVVGGYVAAGNAVLSENGTFVGCDVIGLHPLPSRDVVTTSETE